MTGRVTKNPWRGWRRLAVVLLVPWIAGWVIALAANQRSLDYASHDADAARQEFARTSSQLALDEQLAMQNSYWRAVRWRHVGLRIAFGVPVALTIAFAAGFWVWRGFRPIGNSS